VKPAPWRSSARLHYQNTNTVVQALRRTGILSSRAREWHILVAMSHVLKAALVAAMVVAALSVPRPATAYSVLAHEANIDALWDGTIAPMLVARFPGTSREQLQEARGFAYGGCVIQDLGYYPFGSHFFSNLLHYVRTGDFLDMIIHDAQDVNEYAFALGALGHYSADNDGHPMAVNRAVALMYPKLKAKYGDRVTYAQSPKNHVMVEFSFDVVQVAAAAYAPEAYHRFIGFQVAEPLLERAFGETYGLQMKEVFFDEKLAIGTYRHAVGTTIPEMTKVAWDKKHDEIQKVIPSASKETFVFDLKPEQYDKDFGVDYEKPHGFARFLGFVYALIPKIGPFRAFGFTVPTPEAERLFLASFTATRERFKQSLDALKAKRLHLPNTDFDTGQPTKRGEYPLADDTYDELLATLAKRRFAGIPLQLRSNLLAFYGDASTLPADTEAERRRSAKIRLQLVALREAVYKP
jgi:Zinc dependent phospholipase C